MVNEYFNRFYPVWPGVRAGKLLGEGSFGTVWELIDDLHTNAKNEVVKEVLIPPESSGGLDEAKLQGLDFEGAKIYFSQMKENALEEVEIMQQLSYCRNIVNVSGCEIRELDENAGEIGWIAFIRMEKLQPFKEKLINEGLTVKELVKLGIDICNALEACLEQGIFHRDIKPENMFYDPDTGDFKLGDFGISCYFGRPTAEKRQPGTLTHMSPQIFHGEAFTVADDLYALGVIIYKLLNDNRVPFLPPYPVPFSPAQRDQALERRLRGEDIPLPSMSFTCLTAKHPTLKIEASDLMTIKTLCDVATKSILPDPSQRYESASSFRKQLEEIYINNW